jgi:hypothetical protein
MCGTLPHTDSTQEHVLALICIMEGQSRLKDLSMVEYLVLSFMTFIYNEDALDEEDRAPVVRDTALRTLSPWSTIS